MSDKIPELPEFIRRDVERAIEDAIHPKGMCVHDGKATIGADRLAYMLKLIDIYSALAQQTAPVAVPDHRIYAVIDSMGWDLDDHEKDDMYRLCRAMLAAAPAAPVAVGQEPVAHRLRNCLGEVITKWQDGPPPGRIFSDRGVEQTDVSVELAYAAPPAAEQLHPLEQFTDACSRLNSACDKVRAKLAEMEAAEHPDTVKVRRELLERLLRFTDNPKAASRDEEHMLDYDLRALLVGGEA